MAHETDTRSPARRYRWLTYVACLLPLAVSLLFAQRHLDSPNVSSRMDTIQSLVERGTFCIDDSLNQFMVDVVKIDGRFYSDKPPLLSVLGAAAYWPLNKFAGLTFETHASWIYYLLTVMFVGLTLTFGLWVFSLCLELAGLRSATVAKATFLTAAGTMFLPYSVTFLNHAPAATTIVAALYCLMRADASEAGRARWLAASGFSAALAFNFDLAPGGCVLLGFGVMAIVIGSRVRDFVAYGVGAAAPLALYAFLNFLVTHDLTPIYLHHEYYEYEGSVLRSYDALKQVYGKSVFSRVFHMLIGYRGFLLYSPILLFGLWKAFRHCAGRGRYRALGVVSIASTLAVCIAYSLESGGMAGGSYGMRWLLALTPFFAFFMALWMDRAGSAIARWLFRFAAAFSIPIALIGVPRPWSTNILSPFTFLDNVAYFQQNLRPPASGLVYGIVNATSLEKDYAYFELGRWHMNHGFYREAVRDLERSRELADPEAARKLEPGGALPDYFNLTDYYLGICYDSIGRPDKSVKAYERLLQKEPENTAALNTYAFLLMGLGLNDKALVMLRRSFVADPNKPSTNAGLGVLLLDLGQRTEAIQHLHRALESGPEASGTISRMMNYYRRHGEDAKYESLFQLFVSPSSDDGRLRLRPELLDSATSPSM